jgi:putative ABC transport system permease protein
MLQTIQDIRHASRVLRTQRWFAVIAIVTMALGTGASTAIFSVIDSAMLHPLPYPSPDRIVSISVSETIDGDVRRWAGSLEDARTWMAARSESSALSHIAIERTVFPARVLDAGVPERVESFNVTEEYFPLFGVEAAAGRLFRADDMRPNAPVALVISHGYWRSRFGGDTNVVGRSVRFDGLAATIVGVLPPGFGRTVPVWRALQVPGDEIGRRGSGWEILGRIRPGVTFERAADELSSTLTKSPGASRSDASLVSRRELVAGDYSTTVVIISSAVGVVLLLACVNVAGLLLARGSSRQPELAIRASLGATRGRLVRLVLTESMVLAVVGGGAGVGLAWVALESIVANIPIDMPGDAPARINGFVLAATAGVVVFSALAVGLIPALRLSRVRTTLAMARAGRQQAAALSRRGGQTLIALEIALAVVMLAGTGVMLRSFARLMDVDLGVDPSSYMTMRAETLDQNPNVSIDYYRTLLESVRRLPGVEAVGAADSLPLSDSLQQTFARRPGGEFEALTFTTVMPGFFEAIGLVPAAGRVVSGDDASGRRKVIVINQSAARQFVPGTEVIGSTLELAPKNPHIVIGVVPDIRQFGPRIDPEPHAYVLPDVTAASTSGEPLNMQIVIRPRGNVPSLATNLRQLALSSGTRALVEDIRLGEDWLSERVKRPRQRTVLLSLLGGLGLVLAVVGVFGVTSYAVARRTQEAGIRVALGARPGQVTRLMLRDAVSPVVIGANIGICAALFSTNVLAGFMFQTSPTDRISLVSVALTLIACATVAAWVPARRAGRIDPVAALRAE